jgi:hypothetical protein
VSQITLRPGNVNDFEEAELEELATAVCQAAGVEVEITSREQRGRGVIWWEVVDFVVTESAGHVIDAIIGAAIVWGRQRLKRKKDEQPPNAWKPRPLAIRITYGPDKKVKTIEIRDADAEPEIKDGS